MRREQIMKFIAPTKFGVSTLMVLVMTVVMTILISWGLPAQSAAQDVSSVNASAADTSNCGVRSVLEFVRYLGAPLQQERILALNRAYPQAQVTMSDVQKAAKSMGLILEGVKANLDELQAKQQPFIAVLPDHFVFIEKVENEWVRYSEGAGFLIRSRADFEKEFQNMALILGPSQEKNILQIAPAIVNWDKVPFGTPEKDIEVKLYNKGTVPLSIREISTSCSCTMASPWPGQILPSQSVSLQVSVHLPDAGTFSNIVTVVSDAKFPHQYISIFGRVENDVRLDPARLTFGEIVINHKAERILILRDVDGKLPRPLKVATTSPFLSAQLVEREKDTFEVRVKLLAPSQSSEVNANVLIGGETESNLSKPQSRVVEVPIQASIVPMVKVYPQRVIFGSVTEQRPSRTLQIMRWDNKPFEVMGIVAPNFLTCDTTPANDKRTAWSIKVRLDATKAVSQVSEKILIKTEMRGENGNVESDETLVPVVALIQR